MNSNRHRLLGAMVGFGMLCFPAFARADDPPAKDAKPIDVKSEITAIQLEFQKAQQGFLKKLQEIEDRKEAQKKYSEEFPKLIEPFVERVFALEKQYPDAPETPQALMWLLSQTQKEDLRKKLMTNVKDRIAKIEVKQLPALLGTANPANGSIGVAVFEKIKSEAESPVMEKLLVWVAQTTVFGGPDGVNDTYNKSIELLVDKYPKSPAFMQLAGGLSQDDNPKWAMEQFRKLIDKNKEGDNRLIGQFGLASMMSNEDGKEKEALAMLESFVKDAKENGKMKSLVAMATTKLKDLKLINNPIQEIAGEDLDGSLFKISDYKGKVVLLDFWGFW